jgi:hypothetical protein
VWSVRIHATTSCQPVISFLFSSASVLIRTLQGVYLFAPFPDGAGAFVVVAIAHMENPFT